MTADEVSGSLGELSDAALLEASRSGDREAFGELYLRYRDVATRVARRTAPATIADDLVAEAFAVVYTALRAGKGPETAFQAYLLVCLRRLAGQWSTDRHELLADYVGVDEERVLVDTLPTPEEAVLAAAERVVIREAFAGLSEHQRNALWLVEVEGLSYRDAAFRMDIHASLLQSVLKSARKALGDRYLATQIGGLGNLGPGEEEHHPSSREIAHLVRGRLRPGRREVMVDHVSHCPACALRRDEAVSCGSTLRGVLVPGVIAPLVVSTHGSAGIPWRIWLGAAATPRVGAACVLALGVVAVAVVAWPDAAPAPGRVVEVASPSVVRSPGATTEAPVDDPVSEPPTAKPEEPTVPVPTPTDRPVVLPTPGEPEGQGPSPSAVPTTPPVPSPSTEEPTPPPPPAGPAVTVGFDPGTTLVGAGVGDEVDAWFAIDVVEDVPGGLTLRITVGPGTELGAPYPECVAEGNALVCDAIGAVTAGQRIRGMVRVRVVDPAVAELPGLSVAAR